MGKVLLSWRLQSQWMQFQAMFSRQRDHVVSSLLPCPLVLSQGSESLLRFLGGQASAWTEGSCGQRLKCPLCGLAVPIFHYKAEPLLLLPLPGRHCRCSCSFPRTSF